jgi:post-segregation antitoxin (ccd killing protein)
MRTPLYDHNATRRTVSVTPNAHLLAKSAAHGINMSRIAEAALIAAFETAEKAKILEELREATRWTDEFVSRHGLPFPECMPMFTPDDDTGADVNEDAA